MTFRSYPHPESRAYTLVRAGYIYPIVNGDKGDHPTIDPGGKLTFDLGVMVNAGAKWGIGAAFRLQTAENDESIGPMIRLRRWLGRDTALDMGVGRLSPTNADEPTQLSSEPQLVGILELQYKNAVSVNAQVETWRVEDAGYSHASGSGTIGYLGFGLHYVPGLVAVAIGLIVAGGSFYSY